MKFYLPLFLLPLLLACNGNGPDPNANAAAPAAPAAAAGSRNSWPSIRLTTWRYQPQDAAIIERFEQARRMRVDVTVRTPGEIIAAAQAGQDLGADLMIVPTLEDAKRLTLLDALQPFFVNAFTNGDVSDAYLDNEGYWAGLTRWTMTAVYNPTQVAIDEVSTYKNLAKLPLRGIRLGLAHPDSSGLALTVAGIATAVSPDAAALWSRLLYQGAEGLPQGGDADQLDRMLAGEVDVAFISSGAAVRWFLSGDPTHFEAGKVWRFKYPKTEATNDNFYNMTCITMAKNARNRNLAVLLIDYLYQKEVQEQLSTATFEYPVQTFALADQYLLGVRDVLSAKIPGETMENNIPTAWQMINQAATQLQTQLNANNQ